MASIPGSVGLTGFIAPKDENDIYAVHDEKWGRGGYRSVADLTARDAITADRRLEGMLVYVISTNTTYQLASDLTTWNNYSTGGSTSSANTEITLQAGEGIASFRIVYISLADGKIYQSDNNTQLAHGETVGITKAAITINDQGTVVIDGKVTNPLWDLSIGTVYIGSGGVPTNTKPSTGYVMKFGTAINGTTIVIDFSIDSGEGLDGGTF